MEEKKREVKGVQSEDKRTTTGGKSQICNCLDGQGESRAQREINLVITKEKKRFLIKEAALTAINPFTSDKAKGE